jgi:hypothetical protein
MLDSVALHSTPFIELDAGSIEKHAVSVFTPTIFALVKEKIHSVINYVTTEILDGFDLTTFVVATKEKREEFSH